MTTVTVVVTKNEDRELGLHVRDRESHKATRAWTNIVESDDGKSVSYTAEGVEDVDRVISATVPASPATLLAERKKAEAEAKKPAPSAEEAAKAQEKKLADDKAAAEKVAADKAAAKVAADKAAAAKAEAEEVEAHRSRRA